VRLSDADIADIVDDLKTPMTFVTAGRLGMHSYHCCGLTVGISVTGADDRSGQLRVVAGWHRALVQPAFVRRESALPIVDLPAATGDATVHCSCTLHTAQPPVDRERNVTSTGFGLPPRAPAGAARTRAVASISAVREASYKSVSQPPREAQAIDSERPRRARTSGRRRGGTVFGGCRRAGSTPSSRSVIAAMSAAASSKAPASIGFGRATPVTLRTYWRAAAPISSWVAGGSRPRSSVMFRHIPTS
jgi:hypothetical protein